MTGFVVNDLEGNEIARKAPAEPGLQLPYLDVDAPGFTWPTHPPVGLPPRTALKPADRLSPDDPGAAVELKRDRNALRAKNDVDGPHPRTAPVAIVPGGLPTRRSLRDSREAAPHVIRTITMSNPVVSPRRTNEGAGAQDARSSSTRQVLLRRAHALHENGAVESTALPSPVRVFDGKSGSISKSYEPFPVLLPSHRDFRPVLAWAVFLGFLGADRFYRGKYVTGILKLATAGGLGIWWVADIVGILNGRAEDRHGRYFDGDRNHRAIAWTLTAALVAGLTAAVVNGAAPAVTAITEAVTPKAAPAPTWTLVTNVKATDEPTLVGVTGDSLRFTYKFPGAVYAYLQKGDNPEIPAQALFSTDAPAQGEKEIAVTPGDYRLVIRAKGSWQVNVEELVR